MLEIIYGIPALIIMLLGISALIKWPKSIGGAVRGMLSGIPPHNASLWAIALIVIGVLGGASAGWGIASAYITGATASIGGAVTPGSSNLVSAADITCEYANMAATTATTIGNSTIRTDPNNRQRVYIDAQNSTNGGAASFNGTLTCSRSGNINDGASVDCYIVGADFRNQVSTTDSNTYNILLLSSSKSKVAGRSWASTAYLSDGSVATTSSTSELLTLAYARDTAVKTVGFYFTLPGDTTYNYLNEYSTNDVKLVCNGATKFTWTVSKIHDI
jgi:hypothetical protein